MKNLKSSKCPKFNLNRLVNNKSQFFARLLKENRAFIKYLSNTKKCDLQWEESDNLQKYLLKYGFEKDFVKLYAKEKLGYRNAFSDDNIFYTLGEIINNSFSWADTPQGHRFWSRIYENLQSKTMPKDKRVTYQELKELLKM